MAGDGGEEREGEWGENPLNEAGQGAMRGRGTARQPTSNVMRGAMRGEGLMFGVQESRWNMKRTKRYTGAGWGRGAHGST